MTILEKIRSGLTVFDGGMGTMLISAGMKPGELPELWNLTHPEAVTAIHRAYYEAGSHVVTTNTFGANPLKFDNLAEIIPAAIRNARAAQAGLSGERYVAYDCGPLGRMLKPLGDLDFEQAVKLFAEGMRIAEANGADLILIETMNDCRETKAAVLAAKENTMLPVFVSNVYDERARLMTGATPAVMAAMLEGLGVDAIGMNCSLGPKQMLSVLPLLAAETSLPILVQPNAGLPRTENGRTVYDVDEAGFAACMADIVRGGARIIGGCCGTTPDYIRHAVEAVKNIPVCPIEQKHHTVIASGMQAVHIGGQPLLIGERINPTGKKRFKQALMEGDLAYVLGEGLRQEEAGAHALDVNCGLPGIDEPAMLERITDELQTVTELPLQLDTTNAEAMERALRICTGKPLINSVNGKPESMAAMFPLAKKYGGVLIGLTLDENGIPDTAEGRLAIAEKLLNAALAAGLRKEDLIIDPLALTVSADPQSASVTLESIRLIKEKLGLKTSLGVSNISFGLPARDALNSVFFAMALQQGLDCAIMNPFSAPMMQSYRGFMALRGMDPNCERFIDFAATLTQAQTVQPAGKPQETSDGDPLAHAIEKGLRERAAAEAARMAAACDPLSVINSSVVPALDRVGRGFEEKTVFLPQLLMSAEAAKAAFEQIRAAMPQQAGGKGKIILATVQGDIHDIGKNIVRALLANYGYEVLDLGKDVAPETIVDTAIREQVRLVGLSALMTTTVPAMAETIRLLREKTPAVRVMVGGAVLTPEYAGEIGADYYAKDAMAAVRCAEEVFA